MQKSIKVASLDLNLNPGFPRHETGILTALPQCSGRRMNNLETQIIKNVVIPGDQLTYLWGSGCMFLLCCSLVQQRIQIKMQAVLIFVHCCPEQCCFALTVTNCSDRYLTNLAHSWINIVFLDVLINSYSKEGLICTLFFLYFFGYVSPTLNKDLLYVQIIAGLI
jgi:hypothetical protein